MYVIPVCDQEADEGEVKEEEMSEKEEDIEEVYRLHTPLIVQISF